jgi:nitrogen regulatory protein P-II 1
MMYLVLFVLHDPERINEIMTAWDEAGVSGITVLASAGLGRLHQKAALRDDFPLIPYLSDLFDHEEVLNRTLFTIVKDEDMVNKVVAATQSIVGDLNQPNTGILVVLPVLQAYGLDRQNDLPINPG